VAVTCHNALAQPAPSTPNIVFILADDLGYGDLGVTGQNARAATGLPAIATPNIDALAAQSMRFTQMYTAPVCAPSRYMLLTGQHLGHALIDRVILAPNDQDVRAGAVEDRTWAQVLQDAGYETGMFGKWHLGGVHGSTLVTPSALPTQKGFETAYGPMAATHRTHIHWESDGTGSMKVFVVPPEPSYPGPGLPRAYGDNLVTNRVKEFIAAKAGASQPFSAYVALSEPHTPHNEVPKDHPYVNATFPNGTPWPQAQKDYAGIVWYMDKHLGEVLDALDDPNGDGNFSDSVADNTIVMFASDNGVVWPNGAPGFDPEFFGGNGAFSGHKYTTREGGIRTPLIVRYPGMVQPGTVNEASVGSLVDIMPTFAEIAGQPAPLGIDGRSMLSDLMGSHSRRPDVIVASTERQFGLAYPPSWMVRVGDWKLIKIFPSSAPGSQISYHLHNLAVDPSEANNLNSSRPDIAEALKTIAFDEGFDREGFAPFPSNPDVPQLVNNYFSQYKNWAPQTGSTDFFAASNWSGGTQTGFPGDPDAQNWNSGPADNWLATMNNLGPQAQQIQLNADANVLGLELRGPVTTMNLTIPSGRRFIARNGARISGGGELQLDGGELNTIREVDIRPGGRLKGHGMITGQQHVIAGIAEFANQGLFEPTVINGGEFEVGALTGGIVTVQGDYQQSATGKLDLELFGRGSTPGVHFDKLVVAGNALLGGLLDVSKSGSWTPLLGDTFQLISADSLAGMFDEILVPSLALGQSWLIDYQSNAVTLQVVAGPTADFNHDGLVDDVDLEVWRLSTGVSDDADADGDGVSDGRDFLAWQRQLGMQVGIQAAAGVVPEPSAAVLFGLAAIAVARRRALCPAPVRGSDAGPCSQGILA
jgi:arylsulfatase A-like enzyme